MKEDYPLKELIANEDGSGIIYSQCNTCIHQNNDGLSCLAFPDSIPKLIRQNKVTHHQPRPELGQTNNLVHTPADYQDSCLGR
jgi:hypothetical protein